MLTRAVSGPWTKQRILSLEILDCRLLLSGVPVNWHHPRQGGDFHHQGHRGDQADYRNLFEMTHQGPGRMDVSGSRTGSPGGGRTPPSGSSGGSSGQPIIVIVSGANSPGSRPGADLGNQGSDPRRFHAEFPNPEPGPRRELGRLPRLPVVPPEIRDLVFVEVFHSDSIGLTEDEQSSSSGRTIVLWSQPFPGGLPGSPPGNLRTGLFAFTNASEETGANAAPLSWPGQSEVRPDAEDQDSTPSKVTESPVIQGRLLPQVAEVISDAVAQGLLALESAVTGLRLADPVASRSAWDLLLLVGISSWVTGACAAYALARQGGGCLRFADRVNRSIFDEEELP